MLDSRIFCHNLNKCNYLLLLLLFNLYTNTMIYLNKRIFMKKILLVLLFLSSIFAVVDINTASLDSLSSVKGLGIKKAQAIIDYRANHCFKSVDELTNIKGIGTKSLEKMRSELSASKCK